MSMMRRRLLDDSYKKTVSGNPVIAKGSLARMKPGLSLYGRSEQQTTTGAQLVNVETSDINEHIEIIDETITLKSGATGRFNYFEIPEMTLEPGTYTMSLDNIDGMQNDGTLQIGFRLKTTNINTDNKVATTNWFVGGSASGTNGIGTVTIEESTLIKYLVVDIIKGNFEGQRFRVMLNAGSKPLTWESYTGGAPSPSPDYPRKIENCGKYGNLLENIYGAKNRETVTGGKGDILTNDYTDSTFVELPAHGHERVMQWVSSHTRGYTLYIRLFDKNKNLIHSSNANIFSSTGQQGIHYVINVPQEAMYYCIIGENNQCTVDDIMLNIGSTALPWEPYGCKIETTLDNAGYLERGSTFDNVKKIALKKGCKYKLYSDYTGADKNVFVFDDGSLNFKSSNDVYNYGMAQGYRNVNNTGAVTNPCRINPSWNPAVEFTVMQDGLYLYYAINTASNNSNDVWAWTGEGYLTDTPYQSQTITSYLPSGLPGIPVSSGGNYTDKNGQQWITDEIDFGRGKYVQRIAHYIFDGSEMWRADGATQEDGYTCYYYPDTNVSNALKSMCSHAMFAYKGSVDDNWDNGKYIHAGNLAFEVRTKMTLDEWKNYLAENHVEYYAMLKTPVETDLSAEEIEAYKALHAYKPTTIITADGGEVEPGITLQYKTRKGLDVES